MLTAIAPGLPPKANRRSEPRILQKARVIEIAVDNVRIPFTLGNLSSLGASGRCGRAIPSGSRVQLCFEGNRLAEGQVRWARSNGPATARARRFTVNRTAKIATSNAERIATIRNVSENGLLIETSLTLAPGQTVRIECGALCLKGQIRWARQGRAGVLLLAPLSLELFDEATRSD